LAKNLSLHDADYELFERKTSGMSDALSFPVNGVGQFDQVCRHVLTVIRLVSYY